jgi:hypothetical protein
VAGGSALLAGVAVAWYLNRPPPEPAEQPRPIVIPLIVPESWLSLSTHPHEAGPDASPPDSDRLASAAAVHPDQAVRVWPLTGPQPVGLPPGTYRVHASCDPAGATIPPELDGPLVVDVYIQDPTDDANYLSGLVPCDGRVHQMDPDLSFTGNRAFEGSYFVTQTVEAPPVPGLLVVVSFTPA